MLIGSGSRGAGGAFLALTAAACLQLDQELPLALEAGATTSKTIGAAGGIVSLLPDFSMEFPAGAVSGSASVTIAPRLTSPFPGDAGTVLPGTSFDIGPAGQTLGAPATVEIRVPAALLEAGDEIKLGLALLTGGGGVVTSPGVYDATSGFMTAQLDELGPVAVVIELDAIDVEMGDPPDLQGGDFAGPAGVSGDVAGAEAATLRYASECAPTGRRCFSSGLVRAWVSDNLADRLGRPLTIVRPELTADLEFLTFDASGRPTSAIGSASFGGTLKARVGQAVSRYEIDEKQTTGPDATPSSTGVTISGNKMLLSRTSDGDNTEIEYGLTRVATGWLLTLRLEDEVELENNDGSFTTGTMVLHVRLRR